MFSAWCRTSTHTNTLHDTWRRTSRWRKIAILSPRGRNAVGRRHSSSSHLACRSSVRSLEVFLVCSDSEGWIYSHPGCWLTTWFLNMTHQSGVLCSESGAGIFIGVLVMLITCVLACFFPPLPKNLLLPICLSVCLSEKANYVSLSLFFSHLNKLLNIFGHSHSLTRKKRIGINYPTLQTFQEQSSGPKAALSFCLPPPRLFEIPQKPQICNVYIRTRPLKLSHSKGITHFKIKLESFAFRDVFSPVVTIFCIWTRGRSSSSSPLMQQTPQTRTITCCSCRAYSLPAHIPRWEKRTEIDY